MSCAKRIAEDILVFENDFVGFSCDGMKHLHGMPFRVMPSVHDISFRYRDVWAEFRAGNLTRAGRDVLLTLRTFRGHGGEIHPSHATLALS